MLSQVSENKLVSLELFTMSQCVNIDYIFPFVITTFGIPIYKISCTVFTLLHNKTKNGPF